KRPDVSQNPRVVRVDVRRGRYVRRALERHETPGHRWLLSCVYDCVLRLRRRTAGCWSGGAAGTMARVTGQFPLPDVPPGLSVLEAVLERITYANEDTGYTIARVATERTGPDLLTVVGPLLGAQVGESLRLTGRWSSHPRYGRQFQVHS